MKCATLSDISVTKVAIEICNSSDLKMEILCAPGSEYYENRGEYLNPNIKKWNEIVEKKAAVTLEILGVAKQLQERVLGTVLLVGLRMLTWAEYHERILGLSRQYSVDFLNNSFFTQRGIIDNKKAAEELMKEHNLNSKRKYKLACLYCFTDHIPALYRRLTKEELRMMIDDAEILQKIKYPPLVKFWSYYLMGEIDKLKGEKNLEQYGLEKALESGSKAAVKYFLERTKLSRKKDAVVDAALELINWRVNGIEDWLDWYVLFTKRVYKDRMVEFEWVPSDYYLDILYFLLSKMREDQEIEFMRQDIEGANYGRNESKHKRSRVLEYFLNWPYQDYFMEKAKLMWEFLPESHYAVLIARIFSKIEPRKEHLNYNEERSYDYRELLNKFWWQSPERCKRYVFSNQEVGGINDDRIIKNKAEVELSFDLFTLKYFFYDEESIKWILFRATSKEKEDILSSCEWIEICVGLMAEEKWETLNRFVHSYSSSEEDEDMLKRKLSFAGEARGVCIDFIVNDKWNAAESFIKWSSLPKEEINKLKEKMICSKDGMRACVYLISPEKGVEAVDKFIKWCFTSEEKIKALKKEIVFGSHGTYCDRLLEKPDQLELASTFINYCLSSEEEIRELKRRVAYRIGSSICEELISDSDEEDIYDDRGCVVIGKRIIFKGGKWAEVEQFVTWCFSSEEEINDFKKNKLLVESGEEIHLNLIEANQWSEAKTFFAWLGLSADEIKSLKLETLFHHKAAREMFREEGNEAFFNCGNKQEAIELLSRWYFTD